MQIQRVGQNNNPSMGHRVDIGKDISTKLCAQGRQYICDLAQNNHVNISLKTRISGNTPNDINCTVTPEGKNNGLLRQLWIALTNPEKIACSNTEDTNVGTYELVSIVEKTINDYKNPAQSADIFGHAFPLPAQYGSKFSQTI